MFVLLLLLRLGFGDGGRARRRSANGLTGTLRMLFSCTLKELGLGIVSSFRRAHVVPTSTTNKHPLSQDHKQRLSSLPSCTPSHTQTHTDTRTLTGARSASIDLLYTLRQILMRVSVRLSWYVSSFRGARVRVCRSLKFRLSRISILSLGVYVGGYNNKQSTGMYTTTATGSRPT